MPRKFVVALGLALNLCSVLAGQGKAFFSSYTEESTVGWAHVPEALAVQLVAQRKVRDEADGCIRDDKLPRNYHQFLVTRSLSLSTGKEPFRFVRPASLPYCGAFYGTHIYAFWIVDRNGQAVFDTSADEFEVLRSRHHTMRDLLVSQCHAGYCYRTTHVFDGQAYREQSCATTAIQTGESVPGCKP